MDFFTIGLTLSVGVFLLGILWRTAAWFRTRMEPFALDFDPGRTRKVLKDMTLGLPRALPVLVQSLTGQVLLQLHILRDNPLRWAAHMAMFIGFTGLLLLHAMDGVVTAKLFPGYQPTLNPYQPLVNLLGVLVLAGVVVVSVRRLVLPGLKRVTGGRDWFALALLAAIVGSGFLLEAVKIQSPAIFRSMVDDYLVVYDQRELSGLKHHWAEHYGVIFPDLSSEVDPRTMELGQEVHEISCSGCHSRPASAFVSYPLSKGLQGLGPFFSRIGAHGILWYVHVLLCFAGLALVPFTKFLHLVTNPLNMLVQAARGERRDKVQTEPARGLGMDSCTHCGVCSVRCSVGPSFTVLGNPDILPSEKLASLKRAVGQEGLAGQDRERFIEGSFICTECYRCTEVCPSRIDLQDLWISSRRSLASSHRVVPHTAILRHSAAEWARLFRDRPLRGPEPSRSVNLTDDAASFWGCVQCTTCTNVCPVVAAAEDPVAELDLMPQQIMNVLRMGMKDLALGARMVWSCVTCYRCQESCPLGVRVADVLYELRNIAAHEMRTRQRTGDPEDGQ